MHCFPAGARRALPIGLSLFALAVPSAALAHGTDAGAESDHRLSDSVTVDSATEARQTRETRAAAADEARAAAAPAGTEGTMGSWSAAQDWPLVGIHVALMPNGKVVAYDSMGDAPVEEFSDADNYRSRYTVWDPETKQFTGTIAEPNWTRTGFNIFCTGLAHLEDGTLFLAGGNRSPQFDGIVQTHTFRTSGADGLWALGANMRTERWYPTVTPLANGEMLIMAGQPISQVDTPEVRQRDGSIRQLEGARRTPYVSPREEYPWTQVGPDGRAVVVGPDPVMRSLATDGQGSWDRDVGTRDGLRREYGSHAMYDVGKILVAGGARPAVASSTVVDITDGMNARATPTGSMNTPRRQHNLTVLADGSVLATGGLSSGEEQVDMNNPVMTAERWDPQTGAWTTLDGMRFPRMYHSTALLLPDGRVLSSGGGVCFTCKQRGYAAKNAEIFTPPYLYKKDGSGALAPRPEIAQAPETVTYDAPVEITSPQAGSIRKVGLVRLGAVTHSVNMTQRYVPLDFRVDGGTITAEAPRNANIAPPGPYMLVVVDDQGVPSVAKMVTVARAGAPTVGLTAPAAGDAGFAGTSVRLAASASAASGSIARVEFFAGATRLGEDTTAPYTYDWAGVPAGTYALTARATDDRGASRRSGATTISVSTPPQPEPPGPVTPPVVPKPPVVQPPVVQPPVVQPPARPTTVADPRARVTLPSRVTISGRTVPVKISCARACRGTLRIQTPSGATRGRVAFRLTRAGTKTYRVAVDSRTRSLARRAPQRLRATMVVQAGSRQFTARRSFTLRVR